MEKNGFSALLDDFQYLVFAFDKDGEIITKVAFLHFDDACRVYSAWLEDGLDVEMWTNDNGTPCCL